MSDSVLTPERILAAAEDVLRRYGPGKATVVDVAQALGVSHGSVYRHFASKAELRDAVLRGWLARSMAPLQAIANSRTPPPARLRQWFSTLRQTKRDNVLGDPELFATYSALAAEAGNAIAEHKGRMQQQIASILAAGVASGDFRELDPAAAARALFDATARFHYPGLSHLWDQPGEDAAFTQLLDLLLAGLAPASAAPRRRKSAR